MQIPFGKSFVIVNDEIHDMWAAQNITLRYKKSN